MGLQPRPFLASSKLFAKASKLFWKFVDPIPKAGLACWKPNKHRNTCIAWNTLAVSWQLSWDSTCIEDVHGIDNCCPNWILCGDSPSNESLKPSTFLVDQLVTGIQLSALLWGSATIPKATGRHLSTLFPSFNWAVDAEHRYQPG